VPLYYKKSSFSNYLSIFNDVAGRVFEIPALRDTDLLNDDLIRSEHRYAQCFCAVLLIC
jgi:hypothetical protein